jgi:hypothetical protein
MFANLPKQEGEEQGPFKLRQNKKLFFDALPQRFSRREAIEFAKAFNIAKRTAGSFLKSCLGKYLQQPEYGVYEKLNQKKTKTIKNSIKILFLKIIVINKF